jgi:putative component of membrane protein insertase Oxa1/YidC/SpoIIIJ protein YidD
MYYYRKGIHLAHNDQIFSVIQYAVGPAESNCGGAVVAEPEPSTSANTQTNQRQQPNSFSNKKLGIIFQALKAYQCLITKIKAQTRHSSCPHTHSCTFYTLQGFTKMFGLGLGIQVTLRTVMQMRNIIKDPRVLKRIFWSRETVKLGMFFGGFAGLFRVSL